MARDQLRNLGKSFKKKMVYAPEGFWKEVIDAKLEDWGLPPAKSVSSTDILHSVNFHAMIAVYSINKKHFLLKLLMNDCGLDVSEPEPGTYELQIVDTDRARQSLSFLAERSPVNKRSSSQKKEKDFREVEDSISTMDSEQEKDEESEDTVEQSETVKTN